MVLCEYCGERWQDGIFGQVLERQGGCPRCRPDRYRSLPSNDTAA